MSEKTKAQIDFTVFLLHHLAKAWGISTPEAYARLSQADIIKDYVLACYDTLHTLGAEYLVDDITELARERGVLA